MTARQFQADDFYSQAAAAAAEASPCVLCGNPSDLAISFKPQDRDAFGCKPGEEIFAGLCRECVRQGSDVRFIEDRLKYTGVKVDAAAVLDGEIQRRDG